MSKTHFRHRQYTQAVIFADSAVIWCLVSILSETTSMNVVLDTTLGVFRSQKTICEGGISGMEVPPAVLHDLRGVT